jgi:RNA polymerase sigma-70 factor (ECF subfamily)
MASASAPLATAPVADNVPGQSHPGTAVFDALYERHARFVWRSVCRLGVPDHAADDVLQEIFLVVHRRLADYVECDATVSWLYAIVVRVVRQYRRTMRRKSPAYSPGAGSVDPDTLIDGRRPSPHEMAEREQAIRLLYRALDHLNDERREVFVLSELEQLAAPEIAGALGVNLNTVYWRLAKAREEFEVIVARMQKAPTGSTK